MNDDFNKRVHEVKYVLSLLEKLEEMATEDQSSEEERRFNNNFISIFYEIADVSTVPGEAFNFSDFHNILKSNLLLMLYNLVESTINNCILGIYDEINDHKLKYKEISEKILDIWFEEKYKETYDVNSSYNTYKSKAKYLIAEVLTEKALIFSYKKVPGVNGNLDSEQIRAVYHKHGIKITSTSIAKIDNGILSALKTKRNELAHGSSTFIQIGRDLTTKDLNLYVTEIITYLNDIIVINNDFIANKNYKRI